MAATAPCRIVVDTFEWASAVPRALENEGIEVVRDRLPAGDYDLGDGVLVERKTIPDLHLSLERGRFWRQMGALREAARLPYLLIEGVDIDIGSVHPRAIRGACLAVVGQGVPLVFARDAGDSAVWLCLLAGRASGRRLPRDRPFYAQQPKPTADEAKHAMLAAVPGISTSSARALIDRFGTVANVVAAGHEAWITVPGIGRERAEALQRALF